MARHSRKARSAIVGVATASTLVLSCGVAYAYWSVTGSGTGAASAGSANGLTTGTATVTGTLYPGGTVTGAIVISNSNPFAVKITSAIFGAATVATAGSGSCTTTGVTFVAVTAPSAGSPLIVAARTTQNGTVTLNYTATMDNTSDTGCQGAGFASTLSLQGTS